MDNVVVIVETFLKSHMNVQNLQVLASVHCTMRMGWSVMRDC